MPQLPNLIASAPSRSGAPARTTSRTSPSTFLDGKSPFSPASQVLSGGERQRLKLAGELEKPSQIVVLDEPTTGLHMADVATLLALLDAMVDNGTTLIVIEHNLDVVARADWIIDMGPGAGAESGRVVFEGAPRELLKASKSLTGKQLAARLG